jgi:4,5-DOPA dioxygenase extradiol
MQKMPVVFIWHGSPMNAIEDNIYTKSWEKIAESIPLPRAILIFSAHWIASGDTRISHQLEPKMIYDMGGFPPELYEVKYEAPGSLEISSEIQSLLLQNNIKTTLDHNRWFDHGVWSVLMHMFPSANIPVICMSIDYSSSPESLYRLWESLRILRESWILIMGSGNIVHNLRAIDWTGDHMYNWALDFDKKISDLITKRDIQWLFEFRSWWDMSRLAHPTFDHLLPIFPLLGASEQEDVVSFFTPEISMGSLSMRSIVWS